MLLSAVEQSLPNSHLSKTQKDGIFTGFCSKPLPNYLQFNSPLCYLNGAITIVNYNCLSTGCAKVTPNDIYNCYLGYNFIYVPMSKDVFLIPSGCQCCEHNPSEPVNNVPIYDTTQNFPLAEGYEQAYSFFIPFPLAELMRCFLIWQKPCFP